MLTNAGQDAAKRATVSAALAALEFEAVPEPEVE